MLAYTYISQGNFRLQEKPIPQIKDTRMPSSVSHLEVFVPVIYTSNTEVYPVPYRALPLGMKWWVL